MSLFTPKNIHYDSYIERGKFLMAYRLTLIFTLVFFIMTLSFINGDINALIGYLSAFSFALTALIFLLITKKYKPVFLFFAISGTVLSQYAINTSSATPHYVDFLWMMVASFLAFIGLGKVWGLVVLIINIFASSIFIFYFHNIHLEILQPFTPAQAALAYIEITMAFFAIGYLMYQFIVFQNYSESKLQKANIDLNIQNNMIQAKNNENETLVKEIHHRVKNNLQIIISLLRLQQSEITSDEARKHFTEAINRVMVMASIHKRLYQEKELMQINLKEYIEGLAEDLKTIFQNDKDIKISVESNYENIDLKTIVPLGLLLNELISNSLKYAFSKVNHGKIEMTIRDAGSKFELDYSDDGIWQESKKSQNGFGLDLIQILTEQLNGNYSMIKNNSGTSYHFEFNKLN